MIISNLTKRYQENRGVFGISLTVKRGEIVGLLGAKGSGKTTAMDLISGAIPADSGTIEIGGVEMAADEYSAKAKLGYASAEPAIYADMTVRQSMKFIADMKSVSSNAAVSEIDKIIKQFPISDYASVPGRSLAPGARRMVGLAQALVGGPEVLLVDEPSGDLDPKEAVQMRAALQTIRADYAILIATENLTEAMRLCDRIVLLDAGRAVYDGEPEALADAKGCGKAIRVTVLGEEGVLKSALQGLTIEKLTSHGNRATATVETSPERLGKALLAAGLPVLSMEPEPIELDDILLKLKNESVELEKEAEGQ